MTPKMRDFLDSLDPSSPATLAYDLQTIENNARSLKKVTELTGVDFFFAVKSFPRKEALQIIAGHLAGFDVSNAEEAALVNDALQTRTCSISFACPGLDAWRLDTLKKQSPHAIVSCENETQVRIARQRRVEAIALRLNSTALLHTAVERGFVPPPKSRQESRFGISHLGLSNTNPSHDLKHLLDAAGDAFAGFHFHHGFAQNNSPQEYLAFARLAKEAAEIHGHPLPSLNLGGGLWTLDFRTLETLCHELRHVLGPHTRVRFEPGRLLSRGAGFAIGRVLASHSQGLREVRVLNLSRTCHVRWAHPQLLTPLPPPRGSQQNARRLLLAGPTCYEDDVFNVIPLGAPHVLSAEEANSLLPVGSLAVFGAVTGYSCAWNSGFNGVAPADVRFL